MNYHRLKYFSYPALVLLITILAVMFFLQLYPLYFTKTKNTNVRMVVVATARQTDVAVYLSALGSVVPAANVTVKTQINGQLMQVFFKEGQLVKAGELLAQIDPRPYQALLAQYQGQLTRDTALLNNARLDLKRYQTLWKQDSIAKQTVDTQATLVKQYEGAVQNDEGLIQATQLNLNYCQIKSPIDGRVGLRLVDPGNYVQTSDANGLVVINTLNPVTVIFAIPEDNLPELIQQMNDQQAIAVKAYDRSQTKLLAEGTLLTVDNQIDPTTGTVKLKAQFANENNYLFPNQFVNIKLLIKTLHQAVVIPTAAIQYGTQGPFVFLLSNDKKTVHIKTILAGVTTGENTTVNDIAAGQQVVVEGADKLIDGNQVLIEKTVKN